MSKLKIWYHGSISKRQAEEILNHAGRDGSYLIRDSMIALPLSGKTISDNI
uniref:SH2 domain-containing protein n=1 Tax=Cyprinus carpio TaxID=7962 RepID=A0A8C1P5F4_CYPCA